MKQILLFSLLFVSAYSFSQVGIGTTAPNSSAALDVTSTNKGFLPPRMTTVQRDTIANPATGLQIYNTTTNTKDYFNGTAWISTLATNSALGTPTSATLTNATGLPLSTGITGTLPIANGGTGLSTIGTNGQVLTSDGTTASWATPTAGGGTSLASAPVAFNAYQTTSQNYAINTFNLVLFQTEVFDTTNAFDTTTSRFNPKVAGYYQINYQVGYGGLQPNRAFANLNKNGSPIARTNDNSGSTFVLSGSALVYMNGTTDYLTVTAYVGDPISSSGSISTQFSGFLTNPSTQFTQAAVQTANFTALPNFQYPVNTTSNAVTITLPASPTVGQKVSVLDYANNFNTYNLIINPNGLKIAGNSANVALSAKGTSVALVYVDITQGWVPETYSVWGTVFASQTGDALTATALSTNLTSFNNAATGAVVQITAAEYALLKAITATSILHASDTQMALTAQNGSHGNNYVTTYGTSIPAGAKFVGFTVKMWFPDVIQIFNCTGNGGVGQVATRRYTSSSATPSGGQFYFAIKTPTAESLGTLALNHTTTSQALAVNNTVFSPASIAYANQSAASVVTMSTGWVNTNLFPLIQILNRTN